MLAIGGGIANVFRWRRLDVRKRLSQCSDDDVCVVGAERCLGKEDQFVRVIDAQAGDLVWGLDNLNRLRCFASRTDDFLMRTMPNKQDLPATLGISNGLGVHFRYQRACRIDVN